MQQLRRDLTSLRESVNSNDKTTQTIDIGTSISLIGAISTTNTSLGRLLGDFEAYVSNQTDKESQNKNQSRLDKLKNEFNESKIEFKELRERREEKIRELERIKRENERNHLFTESNDDRSGIASGISDNPYSIEYRSTRKHNNQNANNEDLNGMMMDQQMKLERSNAKLDEILEMGRHAFEDIVEQNETILKVKDKMSQGLATLGVSRETVTKIEKVLWEDKIIFYVAGSLTLFIMWLIWHYLG
ncbi:protein transport protein bos1 [Pichia californica]|uniref:Protein transport protein BOS1 n=1 Tax=Pichia californica TaxID=460514 RepID=A0A9P7BHM8_9ASCO|nr:protein transport protein bos1 [[Candida] californica]KAG0689628.1 protein transport protein bos1 [[Candida] californica]